MNVEEVREFCLSFPHTTECFPFDEVTLVFKVAGKMFGLLSLDEVELRMNLKCDPEKAVLLREKYDEIKPGYHMSKKHWNTVSFKGNLSDDFLKRLIKDSYDLVVAKLPKKQKRDLKLE